jgi:lipid-A-disaccharide synthase-like uncharacterized protein
MADDTILSWNTANWITVGVIAITIFVAIGFVQKWMQQKVNNQPANS